MAADDPSTSAALMRMCSYTRVIPGTPWHQLVFLIAWAPFGLLLAALRLLVLPIAGWLIEHIARTEQSRRRILHALMGIWGMHVHTRRGCKREHLSRAAAEEQLLRARVIVVNHVSQLDSVPLRLLAPFSSVLRETYRSSFLVRGLVEGIFDPVYVPIPRAGDVDGRRAAREAILEHVRRGSRVVVFPEGSITNGTPHARRTQPPAQRDRRSRACSAQGGTA